jgi:hypothetical protein
MTVGNSDKYHISKEIRHKLLRRDESNKREQKKRQNVFTNDVSSLKYTTTKSESQGEKQPQI